jgi:WD40 repeat protein
MTPVKAFPKFGARINHLHYSEDGKLLIASSDDESINLYDCISGSFNRTVGFLEGYC